MKFLITVLSLLFISSAQLSAEVWQQGALALHSVEGKVTVSGLGGAAVDYRAIEAPVGMAGLLNAQAVAGASALFSTSNRNFIYLEGDGSFSIERFEQAVDERGLSNSDELEPGQSRMIVSFRKGDILMDARSMLDVSHLLMETPLGRLTAKKALWHMNIVFDPRSEIFDFTISCSSGQIRFTDLRGYVYTLRTGQRLSGAGARFRPSVEIGKMEERSMEKVQIFQDLVAEHIDAAKELALYADHVRIIGDLPSAINQVLEPNKDVSKRVPIVIEYSSDPTPVTPFRGETKPPSKYQADLF